MNDVTTQQHQGATMKLMDTLATYKEAEDLINIGAYVKGNNPKIDYSIKKIARIQQFLRQGIKDSADLQSSIATVMDIMRD